MIPSTDYLKDESGLTGISETIYFPETEAEVIEILSSSEGRVTFQGSRTGICGGAVPDNSIILSTEKLKGIGEIIIDGDAAQITVQAGITIEELDKALLKQGGSYIWPPHPSEETASVGAVCALGSQGINACYYGRSSDYIRSLRAVDSKGKILLIDSPEDIMKLEETEDKGLLILEADLILTEKAECCWGIEFFFEEESQAAAFGQWLKAFASQLANGPADAFISAMEFADEASMKLADKYRESHSALKKLPPFPDNAKAMIYVEISGGGDDIMDQLEELLMSSEEFGSDPEVSWAQTEEGGVEQLRTLRHTIAELANMEIAKAKQSDPSITKLALDLAWPDRDFAEILNTYRGMLDRYAINNVIFGHIHNNNLHVNLLPATRDEYLKGQDFIRSIIADALDERTVICGEHGLGRIKAAMLPEGVTAEEIRRHNYATFRQ